MENEILNENLSEKNEDLSENFFKSDIGQDVFDELLTSQFGIQIEKKENEDIIQQDDNPVNIDGIVNETKTKNTLDDIFEELHGIKTIDKDNNDEEGNIEDELIEKNKGGRPLNTAIKKLIEENVLLPFDDDKPIEKYNSEDIIDLIKENIQNKINEVQETTIENFIKSLPTEIQVVIKYVSEGGADINKIFTYVSKINDISKLEVGKDDELIVRTYLENTKFGTKEDIDEQIELLITTNKLTDFASKFKPKLDELQKEIIDNEIKKQEEIKQQQQQFVQKYIQDVNTALSDKKINDITLSPTKINSLINGLVSVQYDSISGRKTNKLGYLLEKHQFKEPNLKLIAEVLWLLENPNEYKEMLINKGKQIAEADLKRSLKTAIDREKTSAGINFNENASKPQRTIKKNNSTENFFKY